MTSRKFTSISTLALLISLLLVSTAVSAQKKVIVTEEEQKDTVSFFQGVSVGVDLYSAVQRLVSDYGQYEANLRVNLKDRYFPVFELGLGDANHSQDVVSNISAKTSALYGRIGCDFNVAKHKHDDYRILLGARYGLTSFNFEASSPDVQDPVWGSAAEYNIKEKCTFHWLEAVFGVDAKIAGPLHLGWSVRYRRKIYGTKVSSGDVWYVPGYGRSKSSVIGGTFNVSIEI